MAEFVYQKDLILDCDYIETWKAFLEEFPSYEGEISPSQLMIKFYAEVLRDIDQIYTIPNSRRRNYFYALHYDQEVVEIITEMANNLPETEPQATQVVATPLSEAQQELTKDLHLMWLLDSKQPLSQDEVMNRLAQMKNEGREKMIHELREKLNSTGELQIKVEKNAAGENLVKMVELLKIGKVGGSNLAQEARPVRIATPEETPVPLCASTPLSGPKKPIPVPVTQRSSRRLSGQVGAGTSTGNNSTARLKKETFPVFQKRFLKRTGSRSKK